MSWNYRIIYDTVVRKYTLCEVFYENEIPRGYTSCFDPEADDDCTHAEAISEIKDQIERMKSACEKPILYFPVDFKSD